MKKTLSFSLVVFALIALSAIMGTLTPKAAGAIPGVWIVVDNSTQNADIFSIVTPGPYQYECILAGDDMRKPHLLTVQKITLRVSEKGHSCHGQKFTEFTFAIRDPKAGDTFTYKITESGGKYKAWESRESE